MLGNKSQSGFTLIEVTLTMAISAMLLVIIFVGQAGIRARAEFAGGIDGLRNDLTGIRNDANTTVDTASGASGQQTGYVVFGKVATFSPATPTSYTVQTVRYNNSQTGGTLNGALSYVDTQTKQFPWGIKYTNTKTSDILFVRGPSDGQLRVYIVPTLAPSANVSDYSGIAITPASLGFVDPRGNTATVTVDPGSGNITRTIY